MLRPLSVGNAEVLARTSYNLPVPDTPWHETRLPRLQRHSSLATRTLEHDVHLASKHREELIASGMSLPCLRVMVDRVPGEKPALATGHKRNARRLRLAAHQLLPEPARGYQGSGATILQKDRSVPGFVD